MANGQAAAPLSSITNGPTPSAPNEGRDASGRFVKGWKGGPGNPFYRRRSQLRAQAVCEITPDEVRGLMRKLYEQAMSGDTAATVVLLAYLLGKPAKVVDPDSAADDEWRRMRDVPSQSEFCIANVDAIPTEAAIEKLSQCRERSDPFDKQWRPGAQRVMDEMAAQRRRRK
jgi:hypothetical protein